MSRMSFVDVEQDPYFKPIKVVEGVHIARTCSNCAHCKGEISSLFDFFGYGKDSFYRGFYVCALEGRETEKCRLTTSDSVCSHHRYEPGISAKKAPNCLRHIQECIEHRKKKMLSGTETIGDI